MKLAVAGVLVAIPLLAIAAPDTARRPAHHAAPPPSRSASSANANASDLAATIAPLTTTSHDVVMITHDSSLRGSIDPAHHAAGIVATADQIRINEVVDSGQIWLKINLGADADRQLGISKDRWISLDPTKLTNGNDLPIRPDGSDPIDMPGILAGVNTVIRVDPTHFTGTVDLSKVTGHNTPDPDAVREAGAPAKSAPYALTTDSQGRMVEFRVDTRGFDPSLSIDVRYADYGAAMSITDPSTSVTASERVYSIFN